MVVDFETWAAEQIVETLGHGGQYDDLVVETTMPTIVRNAGDWEKLTLPAALIEFARAERTIRKHGASLLTIEKTYPGAIVLICSGDQITAPRDAKTLEARLENLVRSWTRPDITDERGEVVTRVRPGTTIWQSIHAPSTNVPNRRYGVAVMALTLETIIAE